MPTTRKTPRLRDVIRLTYTLVDAWMDSYPGEPASVTLDIDDRRFVLSHRLNARGSVVELLQSPANRQRSRRIKA
jgi:hypothetical protein